MVTIGRHKKQQEEPKIKPKVYYQKSDLAFSKWTLGNCGIYFVHFRFIPEFIHFMDTAGFTAEESKVTFSVDSR